MIEYPKIETLYDRDAKFKVDTTKLRLPEFANIKQWLITEKVDGTNIRIGWFPQSAELAFKGRTDQAQIPAPLLAYLQATFTPVMLGDVFGDKDAVLFGEGYGEKIQNGDGYRQGVSFRLFDVNISGLWLNQTSVENIAANLGIHTVPYLAPITALPKTRDDLAEIIDASLVALRERGTLNQPIRAEGIVARTDPLLLLRNGERLMWKLKFRDF